MRYIVTGHTSTGAIHTVKVNSATEAFSTEDGMYDSGYAEVLIEAEPGS